MSGIEYARNDRGVVIDKVRRREVLETVLDHRRDLGSVCDQLGLVRAVEIGTHQGVFADEFLSKFGGKLICVDTWEGRPPPPHKTWLPAFVETSESRELDYEIAKLVLKLKYGNRVSLIRASSLDSAAVLDRLDDYRYTQFAYIDGSHKLSDVKADIETWWPLIEPGGILAGHDYVFGDPNLVGDHNLFSVKIAVDHFCAVNGLDLYLTKEPIASWYVEKPL